MLQPFICPPKLSSYYGPRMQWGVPGLAMATDFFSHSDIMRNVGIKARERLQFLLFLLIST